MQVGLERTCLVCLFQLTATPLVQDMTETYLKGLRT